VTDETIPRYDQVVIVCDIPSRQVTYVTRIRGGQTWEYKSRKYRVGGCFCGERQLMRSFQWRLTQQCVFNDDKLELANHTRGDSN
jgi:hypothetical protein